MTNEDLTLLDTNFRETLNKWLVNQFDDTKININQHYCISVECKYLQNGWLIVLSNIFITTKASLKDNS